MASVINLYINAYLSGHISIQDQLKPVYHGMLGLLTNPHNFFLI